MQPNITFRMVVLQLRSRNHLTIINYLAITVISEQIDIVANYHSTIRLACFYLRYLLIVYSDLLDLTNNVLTFDSKLSFEITAPHINSRSIATYCQIMRIASYHIFESDTGFMVDLNLGETMCTFDLNIDPQLSIFITATTEHLSTTSQQYRM